MNQLLLALAAGAVGLVVGLGTHRLNQALAVGELEAEAPPLPLEWVWAPVLDAVLLAILVYRFGLGPRTIAGALVIVVLVQVLVFDARHRLILNRVIYPVSLAALLASPVNPLVTGIGGGTGPLPVIVSSVVAAVVAGGLFFVIVLVSGGGVGLGDAKLAFFMGASLGFFPILGSPILRALLYGVVLGGVIAFLLLVTRIRGMRDYIPYGPYLCLGAMVALLTPCGLLGPVSC